MMPLRLSIGFKAPHLQSGQLQFMGFFCPSLRRHGSQKMWPQGSTWKGSWSRSRQTGQITSSGRVLSSGSASRSSLNLAAFFSSCLFCSLRAPLSVPSLLLLFLLSFSFCFLVLTVRSSSVEEDSLLASSAWSDSVLDSCSLESSSTSTSPLWLADSNSSTQLPASVDSTLSEVSAEGQGVR